MLPPFGNFQDNGKGPSFIRKNLCPIFTQLSFYHYTCLQVNYTCLQVRYRSFLSNASFPYISWTSISFLVAYYFLSKYLWIWIWVV